MEGKPEERIEDKSASRLDGHRFWSTHDLVEGGAVFKKNEKGNSELILTEEQIAEMQALDAKYSVFKTNKKVNPGLVSTDAQIAKMEATDARQEELRMEDLKDLSRESEVLLDKDRTKQIFVGVKEIGKGILFLGLGTPIVFAAVIDDGIYSVKYGIKIIEEAIKGIKFTPPEFI